MTKRLSLLGALAFGGIAFASATAHTRPDRNGPPKRPPQEAIKACEASEAGDSCEFTHDDKTITGECRLPPAKEDRPQRNAEGEGERPLACVPDRQPPPRR